MATTLITSNCVNYSNISSPPITTTIRSTDYPISSSNPQILPVTITLPTIIAPYSVDVKIGTIASYTLNVDANNVGSFSNIINCNPQFTTEKPNGGTYILGGLPIPNATVNIVTLDSQTPKNPLYDNGDQYKITMISGININASTACAQIIFIRKNNVSIDDNVCNDKNCFCTSSCTTVRIPIINILGQSMLNGSDVSDMTFTIFDKFTYYEKKCIVDDNKNKCQLLRLECSKLKETTFIKCCPWMVSVTKGEGSTLNEKLQNLISLNLQPNNIGINEFLSNIIKYGMTRYILSRILYGKFCIDYLLEKHYKKFIKDLGRSRFCRFIEFFEDCTDSTNNFVGYEKYFLCDKEC